MHPLPPNPNPNPRSTATTGGGGGHRRARSELTFRLPSDLDLAGADDADEIGSEDDLFCTFMDIEKLGSGVGAADEPKTGKHRHSSSVDAAGRRDGVFGESLEAKKAMTPEQLAELAAIDPKRAKREKT